MRWGCWRGKLTKTAMEKMKPWDEEEITRRQRQAHFKCRKELDKVDWEMMKKHLRTPEALQAYEKLCNDARYRIPTQVTELISKRKPDVRLQYYYGKFAYLPFKERLLSKWSDAMGQFRMRYPLETKLLRKMLPASKKLGVVAAGGLSVGAVGLGAVKCFGNVNEQK